MNHSVVHVCNSSSDWLLLLISQRAREGLSSSFCPNASISKAESEASCLQEPYWPSQTWVIGCPQLDFVVSAGQTAASIE